MDVVDARPTLYWLGPACRYREDNPNLKGIDLLDVDLGGRELGMPFGTRPEDLFDRAMATLLSFQQQIALQTRGEPEKSAAGATIMFIQAQWCLASVEISRLQERCAKLEQEIKALHERLPSPSV